MVEIEGQSNHFASFRFLVIPTVLLRPQGALSNNFRRIIQSI